MEIHQKKILKNTVGKDLIMEELFQDMDMLYCDAQTPDLQHLWILEKIILKMMMCLILFKPYLMLYLQFLKNMVKQRILGQMLMPPQAHCYIITD